MNSLPNPSSDIDEPEAPTEPLGWMADPKLLSSSPPPSAPSPSETSAAKFASDIFDWGSDDTLADSSSASPYDDFQFLGSSDPALPNVTHPLSTDLDFDYRLLGTDDLGGLGDVGAEFGIGEFWQSVKPLMEQSPWL